MPLLLTTIQQEFANLMDKNAGGFVGYPQSPTEVAENWSNVLFNYSQAIIPLSTTAVPAKQAMKAILTSAVAPNSFFPALISGYSAFATTLAGGMLPTFTGTPPPTPIPLSPILALPLGTPVGTIIGLFSTLTDTWFRTGTAINISSGATINWN